MTEDRPANVERAPSGEGDGASASAPASAAASPLRVVLHSLEEQLDERVHDVRDAKPARQETTAELIHLEEELEAAQDKAKQLVTLRLKLGENGQSMAEQLTEDAQPNGRPDPGHEPAA